VLGVISTHWHAVHEPGERELRFLDLVARQAADLLERQRHMEALLEAGVRKDEFLAMLAHELRNPLAAIHHAGELLRREDSAATSCRRAVEILHRQTEHMVRQVDDLLDVSRISRGKVGLRKEVTDMASAVKNAVEAVRPLCDARGHELVVTLPAQPMHLHADPTRLTQVVTNLLTNACKFTGQGGRITVSVEQEGLQGVIRVSDNGIGMAPSELTRIFEIFAQVDRSRDSTSEGLGLGLALVKTLVEMHDGTVEARSEGLGQGSEFVVRLPLVHSSAPESRTSADEGSKKQAASSRVLVVDDNRDVAGSLAMVLELAGHHVEMVHDGPSAIKKAASYQADVILLDIGMPGMNGYEVARQIRAQGQKGLTLVAITGWGQDEDRQLSKEAGFDAHLVKPVDFQVLMKLFPGVRRAER
jgi:signal transduction histidine kinase